MPCADAGLRRVGRQRARSGSRGRARRRPAGPRHHVGQQDEQDRQREQQAARAARRGTRSRRRCRACRPTPAIVDGRAGRAGRGRDGRHRASLVRCRTRRTKASPITLSTRVMRNSSRPDEEQALERGVVAGDLVATRSRAPPSPPSSSGRARAGSSSGASRRTRRRRWPRPSSRRSRAVRRGSSRRRCPRSRPGTTTRSRGRDPSRAEAVRGLAEASGTARIASSEIDATSGIDRMPTPTPAAARLNTLGLGERGSGRSRG